MNRPIRVALLVASSLLGCIKEGGEPGTTGLNLQIEHTDCINGRLDYFGSSQPADALSVSITGDGIDAPIVKDVTVEANPEMPAVPDGTNRVVTVLAKRQGASVAYGASSPFDLKNGEKSTVHVLMYPMWQFAHAGDAEGQCTSITPRAAAAATLLKDGRVLITGGYILKAGPSTYKTSDLTLSAQIFDPRTGLVTNAADMPADGCQCTGRGFDTAITLDDGRVLVTGGLTLHPPRKMDAVDLAIYDPGKDTWSVAPLTTPRREFVPVLLQPDNAGVRKVVAISGRPAGLDPNTGDERDLPLTTSETFDPATNEWTDGGEIGGSFPGLSSYRVGELALSGFDPLGRTLSQGFALASGYAAPVNAGESGPFNDTLYAFDRSTGRLLGTTFKLPMAVLDPAVVGLNKSVLVLGGFRADDQTVSNQWYLWNGQSAHETGSVNNGEADACTVVLDQTRSLIIGGQPLKDTPQGDSQVLMATQGITGTATVGPALIPGTTESVVLREGRQGLSCVRLNDHQVLVMGGYGQTTGGLSTLGTMEIFTFD